jgi:antirestriction protein ArdC
MPRHRLSGRPSRGINVWLTASAGFASPDWLTVNQAHALGGSLQKSATGTPVVLWTWDDAERDGDATEARRVPLVRSYTVFNVEHTTGIDLPVDSDRPTFQPIARGETLVANMPQRPRIQPGATRACDRPSVDVIDMPHPTCFDAPEAYYSTLFHELTHSTGHASRVHRITLTDRGPFGSTNDSKEALVAEMGAAFLCGICGLENRTVDHSTADIASW